MADKTKSPTSGTTQLPISRVRTIMKSSPEVSAISQESLYLITRATELFVQDLALRTLTQSDDGKAVDYTDLARLVDESESLMFLQDIIPKKIKVKDYYALIGKKVPGQKEPEVVEIDDDDDEEENAEEAESVEGGTGGEESS